MKSQFELVSSFDFFDRFEKDIDSAKKFVFILIHIWRNDENGRKIMDAVLRAARRNVKVFIIKDKVGVHFELSEKNCCPMFHRKLPFFSRAKFSSAVHKFLYGYRSDPSQGFVQAKHRLSTYSNIQVFDGQDLFDHSKVALVDGHIGYVGGINIENQEEIVDNVRQPIVDFTLRFDDSRLGLDLLRSIQGGRDVDSGLEDVFFHGAEMSFDRSHKEPRGSSRMVEFIENTQKELVVAMAYLGQPEYAEAIIKKAKEGKSIHIITSKYPTNFFRRVSVLISILRRSPPGTVRVDFTGKLLHAKLMQRDGNILWAGSKNMSLPVYSTDETVAVTRGFVEDIREIIAQLCGSQIRTVTLEDLENFLKERKSSFFLSAFEGFFSNLLRWYAKKYIRRGRRLKKRVVSAILEDGDLWTG